MDAATEIGVTPCLDGMAADDPDTRLRHGCVRARLRWRAVELAAFVVVAGGLFGLTAWHPSGVVTSAALVPTGLAMLWARELIAGHRRSRAIDRLCRNFPWRPVSFTLIRSAPHNAGSTGIAAVDGQRIGLQVFRVPWLVRMLLVWQGRAWLCGPDSGGRGRLRVAGVTSSWEARVLKGVPAGERVTEPRSVATPPASNRNTVAALASVALPIVLAALVYADGLRLGQNPAYLVAGESLSLLGLAQAWRLWRRAANRLPRPRPGESTTPTAVSFELTSWAVRRRMPIGPAKGVLGLPDGARFAVTVPRANLDLIANIRAGGQVILVGAPEPGRHQILGIANYPVRLRARIDGAT